MISIQANEMSRGKVFILWMKDEEKNKLKSRLGRHDWWVIFMQKGGTFGAELKMSVDEAKRIMA